MTTEICRKVVIVFRGKTIEDAEDAFDEACARLRDGCVEGSDSNESSGFYFTNTDDVPKNERPR